jgi:hypothetical protein
MQLLNNQKRHTGAPIRDVKVQVSYVFHWNLQDSRCLELAAEECSNNSYSCHQVRYLGHLNDSLWAGILGTLRCESMPCFLSSLTETKRNIRLIFRYEAQ